MLLDEILVFEFRSVDGFSSGAVAGGEIPTLAHEPGDDSMESRALVVQGLTAATGALLAGAKGPKVLRRARRGVGIKFYHNAASRRSADGDVKENLRVGHRKIKGGIRRNGMECKSGE